MSKRIQFDFADSSVSTLERLKEATDAASLAEVVRNALRCYDWVIEQTRAGHEIAAVRDGKIVRTVTVLA